eukprot:TRINITY_DN80679_c0_g1_i1.p1 TRINITY_DN80679_c0_g1~~TRINITY_DN80679_c0_g1_i1.p1  ORF type:complete len:795 (-),score=134.52 TRINITY_DN80679_c0_g1_i1:49-2370(-)
MLSYFFRRKTEKEPGDELNGAELSYSRLNRQSSSASDGKDGATAELLFSEHRGPSHQVRFSDVEMGSSQRQIMAPPPFEELHVPLDRNKDVEPSFPIRLAQDLSDRISSMENQRRCNFNIARGHREFQPPEPLGCYGAIMQRFIIIPELREDEKARGKINPVEIWDLANTLLLFAASYYLPWASVVGKREIPIIRGTLNIIFTFDMFLQFCIAYSNPHADMSRETWETDPWKIAKSYMGFMDEFGWFWIDALGVLPWWLNFFSCGRLFYANGRLKYLGLLRALRIFRMINLPRLAVFMQRWHATLGFSYYLVDLVKFILVTTLAAHWFACLWIAIEGRIVHGDLSYHTDGDTWLSVLIESKGDPCSPSAAEDPFCVYQLALYWSTMTLTTVGYGDVTPQNLVEYSVCTAVMLLTGFVWAYIVGSVVSLIQNIDPASDTFKRNMDSLNDLMHARALPPSLQVRMRRYMHECVAAQQQNAQENLLRGTISEGLQREVAHNTEQQHLLEGIYWAQDFPSEAKMELVKSFHPDFFGPGEVVMMRQVLMVVHRGILAIRGQILRRGDVCGIECILLESQHLVEAAAPRTLSYVFVMKLVREDLLEISRAFPEVDKILRKAQIRSAVRKALFFTAKQEKEDNAKAQANQRTTIRRGNFTARNSGAASNFLSMELGRSSQSLNSPGRSNKMMSEEKPKSRFQRSGSFSDAAGAEEDGLLDVLPRVLPAYISDHMADKMEKLESRVDLVEQRLSSKQDQILHYLHELRLQHRSSQGSTLRG